MFKVEKITEKVDLKVNDSDPCKLEYYNKKNKHYPASALCCLDDCCQDCSPKTGQSSYLSIYY